MHKLKKIMKTWDQLKCLQHAIIVRECSYRVQILFIFANYERGLINMIMLPCCTKCT